MTSRTFVWNHRVTYAECTVGNHVYYGRYLDFMEEARGEFFRALGHPMLGLQHHEVIFPATECHLQYLAPARYDDTLQVAIQVSFLRRVRLGFGYGLSIEGGEEVLRATTVHACTDLADKPRRIPDDLAKALEPYLVPDLHVAAGRER